MDQDRSDAAKVYRSLRDDGDQNVEEIARRVFPWAVEGPASSIRAIHRSSVGRVFAAVRYIRAAGTAIYSYMGDPVGEMSVFTLTRRVETRDVRTLRMPARVRSLSPSPLGGRRETLVTAEMSQPSDSMGDLMGVWHEGSES